MTNALRILFLACFSMAVLHLPAQLTQNHLDPDAEFKQAKDLFQKEAFSLAYPVFKKIYNNVVGNSYTPAIVLLESKYYYIICGLQLNDASAVPMAIDFIELENVPARIQMMRFHLGEYYFRKQEFGKALQYYQGTPIANLSNREIADMKFHQAYGYFVM